VIYDDAAAHIVERRIENRSPGIERIVVKTVRIAERLEKGIAKGVEMLVA
jgi:hypothetical protein